MKVLLIRLDKIGDLICSLPVDHCPPLMKHQSFWLISKGLGFVPENASPRRHFTEVERFFSLKTFLFFLQYLRTEKFEMAISFQAPWWIHLALWLTRVPQRVGVLSQWHSYIFLNKSLRQKRSLARQHEADYNADLVDFAFDQLNKPHRPPTPVLQLTAPVTGVLAQLKLSSKSYFVVHPGMAGSALNWPVKNYILALKEILENSTAVLTGTAGDEEWLAEIKKTFQGHPRFVNLQGRLSSNELLEVLANAKHVIAPSTGVLHLAASLGTDCTGIYSPIQVQAPIRWAARSIEEQQVRILSPHFSDNQSCPAQFKCLQEKCIHFFCMEKITVDSVLSKV